MMTSTATETCESNKLGVKSPDYVQWQDEQTYWSGKLIQFADMTDNLFSEQNMVSSGYVLSEPIDILGYKTVGLQFLCRPSPDSTPFNRSVNISIGISNNGEDWSYIDPSTFNPALDTITLSATNLIAFVEVVARAHYIRLLITQAGEGSPTQSGALYVLVTTGET